MMRSNNDSGSVSPGNSSLGDLDLDHLFAMMPQEDYLLLDSIADEAELLSSANHDNASSGATTEMTTNDLHTFQSQEGPSGCLTSFPTPSVQSPPVSQPNPGTTHSIRRSSTSTNTQVQDSILLMPDSWFPPVGQEPSMCMFLGTGSTADQNQNINVQPPGIKQCAVEVSSELTNDFSALLTGLDDTPTRLQQIPQTGDLQWGDGTSVGSNVTLLTNELLETQTATDTGLFQQSTCSAEQRDTPKELINWLHEQSSAQEDPVVFKEEQQYIPPASGYTLSFSNQFPIYTETTSSETVSIPSLSDTEIVSSDLGPSQLYMPWANLQATSASAQSQYEPEACASGLQVSYDALNVSTSSTTSGSTDSYPEYKVKTEPQFTVPPANPQGKRRGTGLAKGKRDSTKGHGDSSSRQVRSKEERRERRRASNRRAARKLREKKKLEKQEMEQGHICLKTETEELRAEVRRLRERNQNLQDELSAHANCCAGLRMPGDQNDVP